MKVNIVIMCGGEGHRLWPKSTTQLPKQFISFDEKQTLIQQTISLFKTLPFPQNFGFFTHKTFLPILKIQLVDCVENYRVFLESDSCNTGPVIALAALYYSKTDPECILIFSPADQYVLDERKFNTSLQGAIKAAIEDNLVMLGIKPNHPSTEYGYIKTDTSSQTNLKNVIQFLEKPGEKIATSIYNDEAYYWNCGVFIAKPQTYLNFLRKYSPSILEKCLGVFKDAQQDHNTTLFNMGSLQKASMSFDHAVMEKANEGKLIPLESEVNDLGSWGALSKVNKNKKKDVQYFDSKNCYVHTRIPTILMGVSDLIVVESSNGLLVSHKENTSDLTKLSKEIQTDQAFHTFQVRPWGYFKNIKKGANYLLKEITVAPHSRLSLQLHEFRSEFWFVTSGSGIAVIDGAIKLISMGNSIMIPAKTKHRLENNTDRPLIIIELQFGEIISEEDIIRYDDDYQR